MGVEIAAGEIIARPRQQQVKGFAIVRRQGKEQGVALPFRGRNFARVTGINDAPAFTDVVLLNCSRAGGTGGAKRKRRQHHRC